MRAAGLLPLVLIAACNRTGPTVNVDSGNTHIALRTDTRDDISGNDGQAKVKGDRLSLKLPGLNADLTVPGLSVGGDGMNLDGMAMHPGTRLAGMDVNGGRDGGTVTMRFTDPASPALVADHYITAAPAAGYALDIWRPDLVSGHKPADGKDSRFAIALRPAGRGTEERSP